MEMQEVTTFNLPDEIIQPFTISHAGETLVICTKENTLILQLKYKHIAEDSTINYVLSRIKCSTVRPTGNLLANETDIYEASETEQRKQIMLDQTIFPNIAKVYINCVQSWVSPLATFPDNANEPLVANLTNMGQLTIYRQEEEWVSIWNVYADVSAFWSNHIYDGSEVKDFERLQQLVDELLITSFCWQDRVDEYPLHFAFGTKSKKIVLCTLPSSEPQVGHVCQQLEAAFVLRYVSLSSTDHLLLAGLRSGRVAVYRFQPYQMSESFHHVGTFFDEDITVSALDCEFDSENQRLLLLAVKSSFLLALSINLTGQVLGTDVLDLTHFMITGLQQLDPGKYIASTMEGAVFHVTIEQPASGEVRLHHQEIKTDLNVASYALYGVATSRTRSCWMFLGYPSKRFDRLALRTPMCVFFAQFSLRTPIHVLKCNRSNKLTELYDAVEIIRFNGSKNIDSLKWLENANLRTEPTESAMYQIKLQLVYLGASVTYQSRRNKSTTDILHNQHQFLCTIIEAINAYRVLAYLAEVAQHRPALNALQQSAVLCLRNFLRNLAEDSFPGDYEYLHLALKVKLEELLGRTSTLLMQNHELCSFCKKQIPQNRYTCQEDHPVFRCVLTKIQIPLVGEETTCRICQRYALRADMLTMIFKDEDVQCPIDYEMCCVCDVPFNDCS